MKNTLFLRLLKANALASIFIFCCIVIFVTFNLKTESERLVYKEATAYADYATSRVDLAIKNVENLTKFCAATIATIDSTNVHARSTVETTVEAYFRANDFVNNGWFAFEPNAFDNNDDEFKTLDNKTGRFFGSFMNINGKVTSSPTFNELSFTTSTRSHLYRIPLQSKQMYFEEAKYVDYLDGWPKKYVGAIVMPIIRDGKAIGVVGGDLLFQDMCAFIDEMQVKNERSVVLFSSNLSVAYAPDKVYWGKNISNFKFTNVYSILETLQDGKPYITTAISPFTDVLSVMAFYPVEIGDLVWYVYVEMPESVMAENYFARSRGTLTIVILGLLIFEVILFFITRNLTSPIREITKVAMKISSGDYEHLIEYKSNKDDEIGALTTALNSMITELQGNAMQLENKVVQRTRDLQAMTTRAEEAAAVKMQFLANMSHEIRTPMNAIIGMSELLLAENLNERQHHFVRDIKISSTSLLDIINDILDLSKLEAGKLKLAISEFDFPMLLENISSLMFFAVRNKGIDFITDFPQNMPACLCGDDGRLRQILINILSNAVKFTSNGYVKFKVRINHDTVMFVVEDTGIGIKDAEGKKLFNVFEQASGSSNKKMQGTGLGLSISKNLVEMMGGTIDFFSTYGKGSSFIITIPKVLGDKSLIMDDHTVYEFIQVKNAKILVVDDNEINLDVASGLLSLCGVTADTALSAKTAINKIIKTDYDLVFLDHMMPEMDGVEAIEIIRKMGGRFVDLPVVALTANAVSGAKEMFFKAGMNDFLSKPIDKILLNEILVKWLPKEMIVEKNKEAIQANISQLDHESQEFLALARKVNNLEVDFGLSRVEGLIDVYKRCLRVTARKITEVAPKILSYLQEENILDYKILVHGMKSGLAEIGAKTLSEMARNLENAANLGDLDFLKQNTAVFVADMTTLGEELSALFAEDGEQLVQTKEQGDKNTLDACLEKAYTLLDDFSGEEAIVALNEATKFTYGEEIDEIMKEIYNATEEFDYLKAMNLIDSIRVI